MSDHQVPELDHCIYLDATTTQVEQWSRAAAISGLAVIHLGLAGLRTRDDLSSTLSRAFRFPYESRGLDAAMDFMSDLDWWDDNAGFLLRVTGTADAFPEVVHALAAILPATVDRWRAQGPVFMVVLTEPTPRGVRASLDAANDMLTAAAQLAWAQPGTGPVPLRGPLRAGE